MQQFYNQNTLSASKPYRQEFNSDAFDLFRLHYPEFFEIKPNGYRLIWKDRQRTELSLYNKLGTNYSAYTLLVNSTISEMLSKGIISNPNDINPIGQEGYESIINYLRNDRDFFTSLLPEIGKIIQKSTGIGDKAEIGAEEVLRKIFGQNVEIRQTAGLGQMEDTHGGKDRIVVKDGNAYNVQIKVSGSIEEENGIYYIKHLGAKLYPRIDIIIFKRGDWYYAFRAKDSRGISTLEIWGDREGYMIPSHQKIMVTKLESRKDI